MLRYSDGWMQPQTIGDFNVRTKYNVESLNDRTNQHRYQCNLMSKIQGFRVVEDNIVDGKWNMVN